jgi:hypothetical protein
MTIDDDIRIRLVCARCGGERVNYTAQVRWRPVDAMTGMAMAIGSFLAHMPNKDNQGKSFVLVCKMIAKSVHEETLRTLP